MGASLTLDLLEAHRVAERGRSGGRGARAARAALRADHVVVEGHAGLLALRSFETLEIDRHAVEMALASVEEDPFERPAAPDEPSALERMARRRGLLVSRDGNGAAHQVYTARLAAPGRLVFGTSERLASSGALGALALCVSATEAAAALAGAAIEVPWPEPFRVRFFGRPAEWLSGDDMALEIERRVRAARLARRVLEFQIVESGALPLADRVAIAVRASQLGAASALFPSDEVTRAALKAQGREADWKPLAPAPAQDAEVTDLDLDFSDFEPAVAAPRGGGVLRLRDLGDAPVSAVWIGPEASLADLERLARAWRGSHLSPDVDCVITIGHRQRRESAAREGVLGVLREAGARVEVPLATPRPRPGAGIGLACGAPGARAAGWHESGSSACAEAALTAVVTDPRQRPTSSRDSASIETWVIDDRLLQRPSAEGVDGGDAGRERASWPRGAGIDGPLRGTVLLELGDHVGVDRILPWGARVRPLAGDIERLSAHLFSGADPDFAARARAEGRGWVVAGRELGSGPRREEIALVAVALGVRGMLARSFAPEFRKLLRQHGLLALRFGGDGDRAMVRLGDELEIPDLPEGLEEGKPLVVRNLTRGLQLAVHHDLDEVEVAEVRDGGLLATLRRSLPAAKATGS